MRFKENMEEYIKRAFYVLLTVFTAIFQNTDGLFPKIQNVPAMLLVPLVVCISVFERPVTGMLFGLLAGFCWDFYSGVFDGFYIILLTFAGFSCSMLINRYMRNNIVTAMVFSLGVCVLCSMLYWLIFIVVPETEGALILLLKIYLPSVLYTLALTPLYYYFVKMIWQKYQKEEQPPVNTDAE